MYQNLSLLKNYGIDLVSCLVERDFKNALQYHDKDDLVGYGLLALVRYSHKYDPSKGTTLQTFCMQKAKQGIIGFVRQKCQQHRASIYEIPEVMEALYGE